MRFSPRPTVFVEHVGPVGPLLEQCPPEVERVMLTGRSPFHGVADVLAWSRGQLPRGWEPSPAGHWLDTDYPVLRYREVASGRRLEVMVAAQWFGPCTATDAAWVWAELGRMVGRHFRGGVLLSTPASTGRDLFLRSLGKREFPVLSDEVQQLIRSTSGQGRIEWFDGPAELPALVEYDGRLMYAGCARELGHGEPVRDTLDQYAGFQRGRYRVDFTAPADWSGVGILPVMGEGGSGWSWPSSGSSWCDGAELGIALQQGWRVTIRERLLFPSHNGRPLDAWVRGLMRCLEDFPSVSPDVDRMVRAAVRAMILHGIGAFHGRRQTVSRDGLPAEVPPGAFNVRMDRKLGRMTWNEYGPVRWPELSHPEWSSAVWARARARLLDCPTSEPSKRAGLLHVPRSQLVACRTDAIYATADPFWPEDGRAGRLVFRGYWAGPLARPTTIAELTRAKS